jgi:SAM-dependent methyltransferase
LQPPCDRNLASESLASVAGCARRRIVVSDHGQRFGGHESVIGGVEPPSFRKFVDRAMSFPRGAYTEVSAVEHAPVRTRRAPLRQRKVPAHVFDPDDPWSVAMRRGLTQIGLRGAHVFEVGVGSGVSAAFMLDRCGAAKVTASDIDERVLRFARRVLREPITRGHVRLMPEATSLLGTHDFQNAVAQCDLVVGNLPQVLWLDLGGHSPQIADAGAHYYKPAPFAASPFNALGLGLNHTLLQQVRQYAPSGRVALVLSGRVRWPAIESMFAAARWVPRVLFDGIVPQCPKTRLHFFADIEARADEVRAETGVPFRRCEFFLDAKGEQEIDARTALAVQQDSVGKAKVFHRLYVVAGQAR